MRWKNSFRSGFVFKSPEVFYSQHILSVSNTWTNKKRCNKSILCVLAQFHLQILFHFCFYQKNHGRVSAAREREKHRKEPMSYYLFILQTIECLKNEIFSLRNSIFLKTCKICFRLRILSDCTHAFCMFERSKLIIWEGKGFFFFSYSGAILQNNSSNIHTYSQNSTHETYHKCCKLCLNEMCFIRSCMLWSFYFAIFIFLISFAKKRIFVSFLYKRINWILKCV